ncbi:GMC oxidoreductase [Promicromonospora panici]|uniref:GMC oxidoreductase n=1 Tax=Promicromonospora panici TaxID=2219658 RepID=UPI00101BC0F1|nr:GMC oxidoreductase [Promicromonospora panici]
MGRRREPWLGVPDGAAIEPGTGPDTGPDLQIFPSAVAPGEAGPEVTLLVSLLAPRSRGSVRLAAPSPDTRPEIDVGLLTDPDDLPRLRAGARQARRLAETPPLADVLRRRRLDHAGHPGREHQPADPDARRAPGAPLRVAPSLL